MKSIILQPRHIKRLQEHGSCQARFPVDPQPLGNPNYAEYEKLLGCWVFDTTNRDDPDSWETIARKPKGKGYPGAGWDSPFEEGEILFVQEEFTYYEHEVPEGQITKVSPQELLHQGEGYLKYLADGELKPIGDWEYPHPVYEHCVGRFNQRMPASSMPEWASRFRVRVKKVWVERIRQIDANGLSEEGFPKDNGPMRDGTRLTSHGRQLVFAEHWDKENPQCPFDSEPWVWVPELDMEGRNA